MKDSVKNIPGTLKGKRTGLRAALMQLATAVTGLAASSVVLLGSLSPLGVILAAAVPLKFSLTAGIGAFMGYLFLPVTDTPFRYISALFAVVSIRLLCQGIKSIGRSPMFSAIITMLGVTVCNAALGLVGGQVLLMLCEGVLAGGLTYFIARTFEVDISGNAGLNAEELASVVITVDVILMALVPLAVGGFSVGRCFTVALILASARFGNVSGGAVSGTAAGFAVALSTGDPRAVCLYAVSGMLSGLFSSGGRLLCIPGFCIPAAISLGLFGIGDGTAGAIVEILLGSALFLLLPKGVCVTFASFFAPPVRLDHIDGMRKSLVMRLKCASGALYDVSGTIDEVAKRLRKINLPEPCDIFAKCERDVCLGCSFRINCWETERHDTIDALGRLASGVREGDASLKRRAPEFYKKCLRPEKLENRLKINYSDYLCRLKAEERIEQVRGVVADQFDGISDMLLDLSDEFDKARHYDLDVSERVVAALREIHILATDCGCSTDRFGRMKIEAKLHPMEKQLINRKRIKEHLSLACERNFDAPECTEIDGIVYMTVCEEASFTPDIGVMQISASGNGVCGDSYGYFADSNGKFYMILSDGMGTGGRAAVDGAMTTGLSERLLKAGFGFDCTLRIVNSALVYKSSDESLSTLDIACIDLHNGQTELYKAGAAATYVKRSGKIGRARSNSLPIGILRDVGFDKSEIVLRRDDMVVLVSDGVSVSGDKWLYREMENCGDMTAQQLAENIAKCAHRRRDKAHPDDITVMVAILNKKPR